MKKDGENCSAEGIHEMREGTPIFVFDESGHLLDPEELGEGTGGADQQGSLCVFQFSVLLPDGHASYDFQVQDERAETFSLDDVRYGCVNVNYGS